MLHAQSRTMNPATPRRSFLAALVGLVPGSLLRLTAAPVVSTPAPSPAAPLLPPPDQHPFDAARLAQWKQARRSPVSDASDPVARRMLDAISRHERLDVFYYGGIAPGTVRSLTPLALFTVDGFSGTFVEAHCHWRSETRTFNLARLSFEPLRLE
jgi:predicted DNA-binding transcriptional regulator YafY